MHNWRAPFAGLDVNAGHWWARCPCAELEALGVARVSLGSGALRATLGLLTRLARELRDQGTFSSMNDGAVTYAEANRLFER